MPIDLDKKWNEIANKILKGKTIKECRYVTKSEATKMGWYKRPVVIFFTDGTHMIPMCDDEGNDGGVMAIGQKEVLPTL